MIKLSDRLHCPSCKDRLTAVSPDTLNCANCGWISPIVDGVADFTDGSIAAGAENAGAEVGGAEVFSRMRDVAGDRWPAFLGDVIAFGCGASGSVQPLLTERTVRSLLLLDADIAALRDCQARITELAPGFDRIVGYAAVSANQDVVRDAVADMVVSTASLSCIADVRSFLTMVYRVLKPGGRAAFVAPNRRFHQAMCSALAKALVRRHAQVGVWPEGQAAVLELLARTQRLLVHHGDLGFLSGLQQKHLFDADKLQDLGQEVGFATAEPIPLIPDPIAAETLRRICQEAGAEDGFIKSFAPLAAAVGQPYFTLLGRRDSSAAMLYWLTKASGPAVRIFTHRPSPLGAGPMEPHTALGGAAPRWSIELLARDTPEGVLLTVGGWCLCNIDVLWVRLALQGVVRCAPVWRPRPDVHEVLNRAGLYHPLNTLCSGLANDLLFDGVHPLDNACPLRVDIELTSGVIMSGPTPDRLVMDQPTVIAH